MDPEKAPVNRRLLFILTFLFIWTLTTHSKTSGDGDEPHYMMIAHSLIFDRDLDLSNNYADKSIVISDGNLEERHGMPGRGGRFYPTHDPGMPLLFAPYYGAAYLLSARLAEGLPEGLLRASKLNRWGLLRAFMSMAMIGLSGLLAVQIFDLCLHFTGKKELSFYWALLTVCSPPILSFSYLFFTELLSALLAVYSYRKLTLDDSPEPRRFAAAGFWTSFLFFIHVKNIGIVIALAVIALYRLRSAKDAARSAWAWLAAFGLVLALRTAVNYGMWGTLLSAPQTHAAFNGWSVWSQMVCRVFGLLLDQEAGLFVYGPMYVLALPAFYVLWRSSKARFAELLLPFALTYGLIVSFPLWTWHGWTGFWSPACRYLVPAVPFLSLAAVFLLKDLARAPLALKSLLGLQVLLDFFFWQFPKLLWNDGDGIAAFAAFRFLPSWNGFSLRSLFLSGVLAALLAAGSMLFIRIDKIGDNC